jgi:hypothetical protein
MEARGSTVRIHLIHVTEDKLKLELDDLRIDSFSTTDVEKPKGTVFGEQCTCWTQCTCPGCPTCDASCNGTCAASCYGSCGATCDYSCGGTCDWQCQTNGGDTCDYTCQGYATSPGGMYPCILC